MAQSLQKNMVWRAVPIAGLAAGTVFLLTTWLLTPMLLDVEPTLILRYFASILLGEDILLEDTNSNLLVGVLLHYVLSILFTLLIAVVVHRWGLLVGIVGGAILGLCLYLVNFYTVTILFEWVFAVHSNVMLLSHVLFGAVAGGVYELLDTYDRPLPFSEEG